MPYTDISELPKSIEKALPVEAQEIFRSAFNSAYGEYDGDEGKAFATAWGAVKKSYEKVDGKWQAIKNTEYIFFTNSELFVTHDAILQTLNRKLGEYFYHADAFDETVWQGTPIIYQKEGIHPDLTKLLTNPTEELKRVNARLVGRLGNPKKEINGHARLKGQLNIEDEIINELINSKKLSLSTAFFAKAGADKILTSTTPNHILVFEEGAKGAYPPADIGAIILNTKDPTKPYGDVEYADPGYQADGVYRYPLDTEKHVRAAWSYINMPKNQTAYTAEQLAKIKAKIESATKKFGITIANTENDMADKEYSKEDMAGMLDFMKANPGMMDKTTMDKMYAAMDGANKKEYTKGVLKDLQSHPEMMDDEMKSMMQGMKKEIKNTMGKEDELANQLAISNTEKETLKSELAIKNTELGKATAQLKVFEQKETERKKAESESRWQTIKNKIPKGLTHKPEDEVALKKQFDEQPQEFAVRMTEFMNKPELPGEDGKEIMNAEQDAKAKQGFTVGGSHTTEA